jgi:hypothetical protein
MELGVIFLQNYVVFGAVYIKKALHTTRKNLILVLQGF